MAGATTLASTLAVTGKSYPINQVGHAHSLISWCSWFVVGGHWSGATTLTDALFVGTTLGVTGATTLGGTLGVTGRGFRGEAWHDMASRDRGGTILAWTSHLVGSLATRRRL